MAQWVLNKNEKVIPHQSLCRLTPAESALSNKVEVAKCATFNASITAILGDSVSISTGPLPDQVVDPYDFPTVPTLVSMLEAPTMGTQTPSF
jgi:hypothetical protein